MPARSFQEPIGVPPILQSRLEAAGLRRTLATRAVLGLFLARPHASLSHAQALAALTARGLVLNRVTLYRLLDRLAACGVLRRHADDHRTWRFRLASLDEPSPEEENAAPLFECGACHRRFALTEASESAGAMVRELRQALARLGHLGRRVEVSVHGTCASCAARAGAPGSAA